MSHVGEQSGQSDTGTKPSPYAWYALSVMVLVYVFNFIDRQILSILAEDVKRDLNLSDTDLGFLFGTAFAIFYCIFGIPLGKLVDEWRRGRLMAIGLALWSSMTALSGLATNYSQLAFARVGVGIGEASASPAAYSLIADYFPRRQRAIALSIYAAALYVGIGLSLVFGASIATAWEAKFASGAAPLGLAGWQVAFLSVGIAGIPLAIVVSRLREPQRGGMDGNPAPNVVPDAFSRFFRELMAIMPPFTLWSAARFEGGLKANLLLALVLAVIAAVLVFLTGDAMQWIALSAGLYSIGSWVQSIRHRDRPAYQLIFATRAMQFGLAGFGMLALFGYSFSFWAPPFAMRNFDASKELVSLYLGLPGAAASAAGAVLGGWLSDHWRSRDPRGRIFVCAISAALPLPFLWLTLFQSSFQSFALSAMCVYFASSLWVGSGVAAFQDLVLPRMRGVVGAITVLASTIIGLAFGPYMVGKISSVTGSLQLGLLGLSIVAPVGFTLLYLMSRFCPMAEESKFVRAKQAGEAN